MSSDSDSSSAYESPNTSIDHNKATTDPPANTAPPIDVQEIPQQVDTNQGPQEVPQQQIQGPQEAQQQVIMPGDGGNGIPGSQLTAAREFAGKQGDDVEIWTAHIDRCKTTFDWSEARTAQIALNKITDTAAKWAEAQRSLGVEFANWADLKTAITKRFKAEISDATAAMAMSELQQLQSESVSDFYDRCVLAMKKKNHRIDAALKANNDFKKAVNTDLFVFFGGGLKKHIRNATICSSAPPENIEKLLEAAKRVELQTETRDRLYLLDDELEKKRDEGTKNLCDQVAALTEEIAALKRRNFGSSRTPQGGQGPTSGPRNNNQRLPTCWTCGKLGHYSRNCFQNQRRGVTTRGGRSRGRSFPYRNAQGNHVNEFNNGELENMDGEENWDNEGEFSQDQGN